MQDVDRTKHLFAGHKMELREEFKVGDIGVFGFYVRGEQRKASDIDSPVEFAEPVDLFTFPALEYYLSELLDLNVDLVSNRALKPHIGMRVLKVVYDEEADCRDYLQDMLGSISDIDSFTKGMNLEQFKKNKKTVNAVVRSIEVIGEASKRFLKL